MAMAMPCNGDDNGPNSVEWNEFFGLGKAHFVIYWSRLKIVNCPNSVRAGLISVLVLCSCALIISSRFSRATGGRGPEHWLFTKVNLCEDKVNWRYSNVSFGVHYHISISTKKMAIILPTGQWYAPSAVINDAWYCMVLQCIALYCIVLHGIAWYCMVLHGIAWYCMVLQGIALYCMVLHGIA